jgi:hypothetical protein
MKFCADHWGKLEAAICARGLRQFVASSGQEAIHRMATELADDSKEKERSTFEPLIAAHFCIIGNVLNVVGLAVMAPNGSDKCPLCFIQTEHDAHCKATDCIPYETWIDRAADDQLARAKELGLVGSA